MLGERRRELRVVEALAAHRLDDALTGGAVEKKQRVLEEIVGAEEVTPHADRPGGGDHVEGQHLLDLVEKVEGIARLAVHLVDEGDDGNVAEAADLEELPRLLL